jgi:RNA polymerase sigma-70 factor (ECF subfamily)
MLHLQTDNALALAYQPPDPPARPAAADRSPTASAILQTLYDTHVTAIYQFIFRKVGNRTDAEDLTSQVFLKAAQHLDTDRDAPSMRAWLYQVARTTITDHWRDYYRSDLRSIEALEEEQGWQCSTPEPAAVAVPAGVETQVAAILASLPENYRRVLDLRFLQGYSLRETAEAMGITEGNVKVLQFRALQKAGRVR